VLDASVAAKWVLPPEHEELAFEAIQVFDMFSRGEIELLIPDLFWAELGNILWKAARSGRLTKATASEALDFLLGLRLTCFPMQPLAAEAARIAFHFDRPVYDSIYLALALDQSCPFLTADKKLVNAVGASLPVRWLGALT
jgi:predicted nucleic acid-binding protein